MSESNESPKPLDFDPRDRIAAAVVSVIGDTLGSGTELGLDVADAVIRELGMQRETVTSPILPNHTGDHRWVTAWKADE